MASKKLNPTTETYNSLDAAFRYFNKELFGNKLPHCLITMQRKAKSRAYFASERFGKGKEIVDEIALNPMHFEGRTLEQIMSTLVHEMTHLQQFRFGKPSRNGYHNKEWAGLMEAVGLIPSDTGEVGGKRTGQSMTHYVEKGGRFQVAFKKGEFTKLYNDRWQDQKKKTTTSKCKFTCPLCDQNAWAKPTAILICGECVADFDDGDFPFMVAA